MCVAERGSAIYQHRTMINITGHVHSVVCGIESNRNRYICLGHSERVGAIAVGGEIHQIVVGIGGSDGVEGIALVGAHAYGYGLPTFQSIEIGTAVVAATKSDGTADIVIRCKNGITLRRALAFHIEKHIVLVSGAGREGAIAVIQIIFCAARLLIYAVVVDIPPVG